MPVISFVKDVRLLRKRMTVQPPDQRRNGRAIKPCYLFAALALLMLTIVWLWTYADSSDSAMKNQLYGSWIPHEGSLVTIHPDGSAFEQTSGGVTQQRYKWSLAGDVISVQRIKTGKSMIDTVAEFVERMLGEGTQNFTIVKLSKNSLTLVSQENNATFVWIRANDENTIARTDQR